MGCLKSNSISYGFIWRMKILKRMKIHNRKIFFSVVYFHWCKMLNERKKKCQTIALRLYLIWFLRKQNLEIYSENFFKKFLNFLSGFTLQFFVFVFVFSCFVLLLSFTFNSSWFQEKPPKKMKWNERFNLCIESNTEKVFSFLSFIFA